MFGLSPQTEAAHVFKSDTARLYGTSRFRDVSWPNDGSSRLGDMS